MNVKKVLPVLLLVVMAVLSLTIKNCNSHQSTAAYNQTQTQNRTLPQTSNPPDKNENFDRTSTNLFFTKHAKCRMDCRHIDEQEIRDILAKGTINYKKSNLSDPRGPTYALEGMTSQGQHLRIIFAPKKQHLTVVTVIDLEKDFVCDCT